MLHNLIGKQNVFFCAETADERHPEISTWTASILPFKSIIPEQCRKCGDQWATEVETRLNGCLDLPAADAVYHKLCHSHFMLNRKCPSSSHVSESKRRRKPEQQCSNTLRCCACGWRTRQKKSCIPYTNLHFKCQNLQMEMILTVLNG